MESKSISRVYIRPRRSVTITVEPLAEMFTAANAPRSGPAVRKSDVLGGNHGSLNQSDRPSGGTRNTLSTARMVCGFPSTSSDHLVEFRLSNEYVQARCSRGR